MLPSHLAPSVPAACEPFRTSRSLNVLWSPGSEAGAAADVEVIVRALRPERQLFRRLGCDLRYAILPVRFGALEDSLAALARQHRPDAILHVGVATRRRVISVETRAWNRADPDIADAAGERSASVIDPSGPSELIATYPGAAILAALAMAGFDAELSHSAGDYVCNAALYRSLLAAHAPEIGFLHVPRPSRASAVGRATSLADLTGAIRLALLVLGDVPTKTAVRLSRVGLLPPCAA